MSYVQGFVIPVPTARREDYRAMAQDTAPFFAEHGARRTVETWGDDVPDGKRTDFRRAVQATAGENVVFSWIEYADKAACDAAAAAMQSDERMKPPADMPFDGARMIYAGFETIMDEGGMDEGGGGASGYVDGFVAAVPETKRDAYLAHARAIDGLFLAKGATRAVETWGIDVPAGKRTDFARAVEAQPGEVIAFAWVEWPDKATRDAGMAALMADEAMSDMEMPFDGTRMIFGGFVPILDTDHA